MTATLAPSRTRSRTGGVMTGTTTLLRFMLRRDRVRLPAWVLGISVFTLASVAALPDLYPTAAERQARATLIENPGTRAVSGPGYGLDDYTFGAMVANEFLSWVAIFVALMAIFAVVRHTRNEEETGRAELVRSSRVGRHATTTAALIVAMGASIVVGAVVAVALGAAGVDSIGWAGSLLFGAALASTGVVFAAVAALTVQVTEHARGANGIAGAVFAVAFTLRAAGDMSQLGGNALSWSSPIGWAQQTRVYVDDRWWPLVLPLLLSVLLVSAAYWLSTRRDVGAGLVRPRPGPAHASAALTSPLGLAWRLHRTNLLWWSVAVTIFALGYGSLASEVERFVAEMDVLQDAIGELGGGVVNGWLAVIVLVFAAVVAVFAALTALRARSEESAGRAESVLATRVARSRWLGSHLVIALAGSGLLMVLAGLGLGVSVAQALGDSAMVGRVLGAALAHVPAIWLTVGIAVALFGVEPRATVLVWVVIAYAGIVGWLGVLLGFPQWALNLSPLGHTPLLPAVSMNWVPIAVLLLLAAALVLAGLAAFRRRDLQTTA